MYDNGVGERIQANEDFILDAFSKDITKEIDSLKVGKYYARVLWATNPNDTLDMTYYKASDTISFNVKGGPLAPISSGDRCIVQCIAHSPAISTPIEFPINKTFKINEFKFLLSTCTTIVYFHLFLLLFNRSVKINIKIKVWYKLKYL